jgi:lysophospholipase L1-like esterase
MEDHTFQYGLLFFMPEYKYLALGDSYTIGEDVPFSDNFPSQLISAISHKAGLICEKLQIIATTGWTTDELLEGIEDAKPDNNFELVSLLIGVNNQYRGYPQEQYIREFQILLQKAIGFAGGNPERVFVVAIPDYGCTPYGAEKAKKIHYDLLWYNAEAKRQAEEAGVAFADVFPASRLASANPEFTAGDMLHPSGKMYASWVAIILPEAIQALNSPAK